MNIIAIKNNQQIPVASIPIVDYHDFMTYNTSLLELEENHCVNYFGISDNDKVKLYCCIANDKEQIINVSSSIIDKNKSYPSFFDDLEKLGASVHVLDKIF